EEYRKALAIGRRSIGFVCVVRVNALNSRTGIRVLDEWSPAWWLTLCQLLTFQRDEGADVNVSEWERQRREREIWTPVKRTGCARQLANDSRFPKAKTEAGRIHLARELLGDEVPRDEQIVVKISREAKA